MENILLPIVIFPALSVSKGSIVKTGFVIGRAGEADDGSGGQVNFMLMIENRNVNPAWLVTPLKNYVNRKNPAIAGFFYL